MSSSYTLHRLKRLIRADGRSISALSRESGVNKAALSRLLNDKVGISIEGIEAVAKALGHKVALIPTIKPKRRK